ncbi:cysteine peptidase family C39 domain-containing protein [Saccharibacillus sp. JS10]|uniref:cysteine peptidase family C39 domain-containing protein n=1 Tax=Saccharibacillus sp. JS10 TaxID=2950552 RepID=UPI00210C5A09|nr:cysteine peptidase family C39 domain-containing protein [Saccharibacillus sp. JS10]MCQ4088382.1 cysteine peptidase family C39 domain-containing protein [Saccharibacillus sp. JS10]
MNKADTSWLIAGVALAAAIPYYYALPKKDEIEVGDLPQRFLIDTPNRTDFQPNTECAAFSSAYVLRHFGVEAEGRELYRGFPRKLLDGTVDPKGILALFRKKGYNATFYRGTVDTLKKRVSLGVPVIAFIKVFPDKRYAHFAPVVGYDADHLYLAESLKHKANAKESLYNRSLPIAELDQLWRTNPFYKQSYIVIEKEGP